MTTNKMRITLDGEAKAAVKKMISEIKESNQFVKITPSKLVEWLALWFESREFYKYKARIVKEHLSSKQYLKSIANGPEDEEELESILKEALKTVKAKQRKNKT